MNNLFDYNYYLYKYSDVKNTNNTKEYAEYHFYNYGYKEGRFPFDIKNFDINYYKNNNIDIKINNNIELFTHYIKHGQFEKRKVKIKNIEQISKPILINISNINNNKITQSNLSNCNRTGIIYVYYERKSETFNQTNLAYFLKKIHLINNCEILFIINNYNCEVNIPIKNNIHVHKKSNSVDFEAYLDGIKYFEKKYNKNIYHIFDNLVFMNCSVSGPFSNNNWLYPFINKLNNNTVCVSPILDYMPHSSNFIEKGPKIPGYFFVIKCTKHVIELLTTPQLKFNNLSRTVFGTKKNKLDTIFSGEYGTSTVLLKYYNIASLLNPTNDYKNNRNWNNLKIYPDRSDKYNYSIHSAIFVKMNWRATDGPSCRDSYPVKYNEIVSEYNKVFNCNNVIYNNLDYNPLNIPNNGFQVRFPNNKWNNKCDFYNQYGKAEEFIIFPKTSKKNLCILKHYDSSNYLKYCTIQIIKYLLSNNFHIYIYTNCSKFINTYVPNGVSVKYNYSQNIDIYEILKSINLMIYNSYLVINTTEYIYPLNNNYNLFKYEKWIDSNTDNIYFFTKNVLISNNKEKYETKYVNDFSIKFNDYTNKNNNNKFINYLLKYN